MELGSHAIAGKDVMVILGVNSNIHQVDQSEDPMTGLPECR
jgi:hypothetical protein